MPIKICDPVRPTWYSPSQLFTWYGGPSSSFATSKFSDYQSLTAGSSAGCWVIVARSMAAFNNGSLRNFAITSAEIAAIGVSQSNVDAAFVQLAVKNGSGFTLVGSPVTISPATLPGTAGPAAITFTDSLYNAATNAGSLTWKYDGTTYIGGSACNVYLIVGLHSVASSTGASGVGMAYCNAASGNNVPTPAQDWSWKVSTTSSAIPTTLPLTTSGSYTVGNAGNMPAACCQVTIATGNERPCIINSVSGAGTYGTCYEVPYRRNFSSVLNGGTSASQGELFCKLGSVIVPHSGLAKVLGFFEVDAIGGARDCWAWQMAMNYTDGSTWANRNEMAFALTYNSAATAIPNSYVRLGDAVWPTSPSASNEAGATFDILMEHNANLAGIGVCGATMKILPYPRLRQHDSADCGVIAVQEALAYAGVYEREDRLHNLLGTTDEDGTSFRRLPAPRRCAILYAATERRTAWTPFTQGKTLPSLRTRFRRDDV